MGAVFGAIFGVIFGAIFFLLNWAPGYRTISVALDKANPRGTNCELNCWDGARYTCNGGC